jgi:hypothetical protein
MTGAWILAIFVVCSLAILALLHQTRAVTSTGIFPPHPADAFCLRRLLSFVTFAGVGRLRSILSGNAAALTLDEFSLWLNLGAMCTGREKSGPASTRLDSSPRS